MAAVLRLMSELKALQEDCPQGISAAPMNSDNLLMWQATIMGPDETPWEGGIYTLCMTFSETEYPNKVHAMRLENTVSI